MNRDPHELVKQRMPIVLQPVGSCLCQAACVAMITRLTLRTVRKHCVLHRIKSDTIENGKPFLSDYEAARFLIRRGWHMGVWPTWWKEPINVDADCKIGLNGLEHWPAILAVKSKLIPGGIHAIVWDNIRKRVLDPHHNTPQLVDQYEIIEWIPVVPFTPCRNDKF